MPMEMEDLYAKWPVGHCECVCWLLSRCPTFFFLRGIHDVWTTDGMIGCHGQRKLHYSRSLY